MPRNYETCDLCGCTFPERARQYLMSKETPWSDAVVCPSCYANANRQEEISLDDEGEE